MKDHAEGEKMQHDELLENAKEAVKDLFNDRSVSISTTRESLEDIQSEIEILLDSLESDDIEEEEEE